ncbi:histidine phosphatase family protein [Comamonas composti]|uniref:histidine phosphatase family protein n=1 Tax=Comamonas composti TaxID=408558 RepID=UPI0003FA7DFB|nr:histidine phosphatase family protein [Comamonas composti]
MSPASRKLWLVRHAQPLIAPGICYGRLDMQADGPATDQAAQALAAALPGACRISHSPLQRCEQLALALQALRPDLIFIPDHRLQELDFGSWEGLAWDAIDRLALAGWADDLASVAPGGGESLACMLERVHQALCQARVSDCASGDHVWISHAGVARCVQWLSAHGHRLPHSSEWTLPAPAMGEWLVVPLESQV